MCLWGSDYSCLGPQQVRTLFLLLSAICWGQGHYHGGQNLSRRQLFSKQHWTWTCRNDRCERVSVSESKTIQSLPSCKMLCSSNQLWPQPTGPVNLVKNAVSVTAEMFQLHIIVSPSNDVSDHLKDAFKLMRDDLQSLESTALGPRLPSYLQNVAVRVAVYGNGDPRLRLNTDESYQLSMGQVKDSMLVNISARSFCGARHGYETLSQLVWLDPYAGGGTLLMLEAASVDDAPRFSYRGLLLDTARNYFPVTDILRTIDAMAANKLNTFHWHATDSQSFPLRLNSTAPLADHGMYDPGSVYTTEDVRVIVRRAALRGIRVLIEVDAPAHVGRAWDWGPAAGLGQLAYCMETQPWKNYCGEPPCGQLNPRNKHVYDVLERIYKEIIELTGVNDMFHIGGDEVSERCWTVHIKNSNFMDLWMEFTQQALQRLARANGGKVPELTLLWSSKLTKSPYLERLDSKYIGIQVWGPSFWRESPNILHAGFRTVLSHINAWYLDCGFGSWKDNTNGHCGPYRSWQQVYEHRPWKDVKRDSWRIEGGVACQWSEQLGPGGLDARVWPRTAALAERLWSDLGGRAVPNVYTRLDTQRTRLLTRGVRAAPLWPSWCSHNPHACLPTVPTNRCLKECSPIFYLINICQIIYNIG